MSAVPTIDNPKGKDGFYLVAYHITKPDINKVCLIEKWSDVLEFKHAIKYSHDYILGVWKCEGVNLNGETRC